MARRKLLSGYNTKNKAHPLESFKHYIGQRNGEITVMNVVYKKGMTKGKETQERAMLECKCDCGNVFYIRPYQFARNEYSSCGCRKRRSPYNATHKLSKEKLYHIWETMRLRCSNPKSKRYYLYGARGIRVCDEWQNDFLAFREWALSSGYSQGLSLDRIDPDGNYEPSNCRWATIKEQQNNRRITKKATLNGVTKPVSIWCDEMGLNKKTVYERIRTGGMSPEEALLTPIRPCPKR